MRVAYFEKDLLLTLLWLPSFFLCWLQTSPEGDDEEVVEGGRPREARVWSVIQWPPRSCVATHRTAKLGPWPSTHGPWSVQPTRPLELFVIVDNGLSVKLSQIKRRQFFLFECTSMDQTPYNFSVRSARFKIIWSHPASHHIKLGSSRRQQKSN